MPLADPRMYTYWATGVEPTKLIAPHVWMIEQRIDRRLATLHQIHNASGQPRLSNQLDQPLHRKRHRSEGFNTTVFPVAIAYGKNHNGIISGKLNGVMIPTTPRGCRTMISSMPGAMSSSE